MSPLRDNARTWKTTLWVLSLCACTPSATSKPSSPVAGAAASANSTATTAANAGSGGHGANSNTAANSTAPAGAFAGAGGNAACTGADYARVAAGSDAGSVSSTAGTACSSKPESRSSAGAAAGASGSSASSDGPAGAGGSGAPAANGCANPQLLFCDDFEKQTTPGMPPPAPWTVENNGMGHSVLDTQAPAHSGKASVKVTSEGGYQTFFALSGAPVFPHDGALYLRLYIRLDAAMSAGHNTYFKAGASGAPSSDHETRMGVMNGMLMINQPAGDRGFLSNEDYYRDGNMPGVVFAPMTWVCVESFFDPANKTIDVWVDGSEVSDLHRSDWEQDPIGALHFGFEKYAGPDATIWYDDIALSTQPIGCH